MQVESLGTADVLFYRPDVLPVTQPAASRKLAKRTPRKVRNILCRSVFL